MSQWLVTAHGWKLENVALMFRIFCIVFLMSVGKSDSVTMCVG